MNFHDKVVLVTGGTGGLGREVTMAFLEAGATVIVTYRVAEEFAAVVSAAERIGAAPPSGAAVDVTDAAAVEKFIAEIVGEARAARHPGERGRRICRRNESVGNGLEDLRPDAAAQFEIGICSRAGDRPSNDPAESRMDRQRRVEGGV